MGMFSIKWTMFIIFNEAFLLTLLLSQYKLTDGSLEYGNTLAYLVPLNITEDRVRKVVQFCQKYAEKRLYPASLQHHQKNHHPSVLATALLL